MSSSLSLENRLTFEAASLKLDSVDWKTKSYYLFKCFTNFGALLLRKELSFSLFCLLLAIWDLSSVYRSSKLLSTLATLLRIFCCGFFGSSCLNSSLLSWWCILGLLPLFFFFLRELTSSHLLEMRLSSRLLYFQFLFNLWTFFLLNSLYKLVLSSLFDGILLFMLKPPFIDCFKLFLTGNFFRLFIDLGVFWRYWIILHFFISSIWGWGLFL